MHEDSCCGSYLWRHSLRGSCILMSLWLTALPLEGLWPPFQSVYSIAKCLEFHYICLHAICAIQYSDDDRIKELPVRWQVVQYCALNINTGPAECFRRNLQQELRMESQSSAATSKSAASTYGMIPKNVWSAEIVSYPSTCNVGYIQDRSSPCVACSMGRPIENGKIPRSRHMNHSLRNLISTDPSTRQQRYCREYSKASPDAVQVGAANGPSIKTAVS